MVLGVGGIAEHAFRHFPADAPGVSRQLQVTRNYSSVTGACLLTRRDVFEEVGGFDEERLPVTFNDVDLCLKMRRAGYLIVYTPFAKLYHHESATRRRSVEALETEVMRERWPDIPGARSLLQSEPLAGTRRFFVRQIAPFSMNKKRARSLARSLRRSAGGPRASAITRRARLASASRRSESRPANSRAQIGLTRKWREAWIPGRRDFRAHDSSATASRVVRRIRAAR